MQGDVWFSHARINELPSLVAIEITFEHRVNQLIVVTHLLFRNQRHVLSDFLEPPEIFNEMPFFQGHNFRVCQA